MIAPDPSMRSDNKLYIKKMMEDFYSSSITQWQSYWNQANIDRRFAAGDQRFLAGIDGENYQNQKFVFNLIHQHRQIILGHQRKNRKSSIVVPTEDRYQQVSDDYTGCLMWMMQSGKMLHKISEAFDIALVTGLCMTQRWKDYSHDPVDGRVKLRNYGPTTMIMDPWWKEMDMSDCRAIWTRDFVNHKQLMGLLPDPDLESELKYIPKSYASYMRFTFMPENYQILRKRKDNYAYDQFYYADERDVKLVHSYSRAETYEVKGDDETVRMWIDLEFDDEEKENVEIIKTKKPCVNLAIAVNDKIIYDEFYADSYDFTPTIAYFDPDVVNYNFRFQGIVRPIRDTQYLFNRRMQTQLQIIESLPTSGIYVTEDALLDKQDAFKTGPGQVVPIKKGYDPRQVIVPMQPPQIDATAMKMTDDLMGLSSTLLGVNQELLGMASDSETGIQEVLRQGASLTSLNTLFDNLDLSQQMISFGLLSEVQDMSPSLVEKILGRPPSRDFYNLSIKKFNIEVEDGLNTQTQKQMQFAQIVTLAEKGLIKPSPSVLLKSSTIQNKQDLIDDAEQQQQMMQQQAQAQQQADLNVAQANAQLLNSQSQANQANALEKMSKIEDNQAMAMERRAKAIDELDDATLRKIEGIKRLQELDLGNLDKFITALLNIKELNQPMEVQNGLQTQGK